MTPSHPVLAFTHSRYRIPELDDYEKHMAAYIEEYGMHSVVKLFRNFHLEEHTDKETLPTNMPAFISFLMSTGQYTMP